jgi:hypothetical protein
VLTMRYYHKFALIGFIIGLIPIALGIIGLTTSAWISIDHDHPSDLIMYGLFEQCTKNNTIKCEDTDSFETPQYFEIIGYLILIVGILISVLCTALMDKRSIHFIPPIILMIGTITILLGFIFYIKCVVEMNSTVPYTKLHLGYSMILMISACIVGYILTAYFSFTAGYIHRHILATVNIH